MGSVGTILRYTKPRTVKDGKANRNKLELMLDQNKMPRRVRRALERLTKPKKRNN